MKVCQSTRLGVARYLHMSPLAEWKLRSLPHKAARDENRGHHDAQRHFGAA
jgi:hypothetical protein